MQSVFVKTVKNSMGIFALFASTISPSISMAHDKQTFDLGSVQLITSFKYTESGFGTISNAVHYMDELFKHENIAIDNTQNELVSNFVGIDSPHIEASDVRHEYVDY